MLLETPFTRLIHAASCLDSLDNLSDRERDDDSQMLSLLDSNHEALETAKKLISPPCARTVRFESSYWEAHRDQTLILRRLFHYLNMEAKGNLTSENYALLIQNIGHILGLANVVRRGGLVVDAIVSGSMASKAIDLLCRIRININHYERELVSLLIEKVVDERECFNSILDRDRQWDEQVNGTIDQVAPKDELMSMEGLDLTPGQIDAICDEMSRVSSMPLTKQEELFGDIDTSELARLRMLIIELSLRSFRDEFGRYPESLDELTGRVVDELLLDPYTGQWLCYQQVQDADSFKLYSTGPSKVDNGGKFGNWPEVLNRGLDYCLDSFTYPTACRFESKLSAPSRNGFASRFLSIWRIIGKPSKR